MTLARAARFPLLVASFLVAIDQGVRFTVLADDQFAGARVPPFATPPLDERELAELARVRRAVHDSAQPLLVGTHAVRSDSLLGWTAPPSVSDSAARSRRIVVIGGDGALSAEESAGPPWPTLVAEAGAGHGSGEPLAIVSLAVAGHDAGQALLRLENEGLAYDPYEVWFVLRARDLARAATGFATLVDREFGTPVFKPRFELAEPTGVRYLAPPVEDFASGLAVFEEPGGFARACGDDPWYPRLGAPARWFALTRLLAAASNEQRRAAALALEDESTLELGVAIVRRAAEETLRRGVNLRVILLPDANELASAPGAGQRLRRALADWGIEAVDLAPVVLRAARSGAEIFAERTGELTDVGQALVASAVIAHRGATAAY